MIVENAHPAIITGDEARTIVETRRRKKESRRLRGTSNRSKSSPYLLSGGLFKCGRCGANMTGFKVTGGRYYVCGSQPYRRGRGCGRGVYVPKEFVEGEVVDGVGELLGRCVDPEELTANVNVDLKTIWERETGRDPEAESKAAALEAKIANLREALEDGLDDVSWANRRLRELRGERDRLEGTAKSAGEPPQDPRESRQRVRERAGTESARQSAPSARESLHGVHGRAAAARRRQGRGVRGAHAGGAAAGDEPGAQRFRGRVGPRNKAGSGNDGGRGLLPCPGAIYEKIGGGGGTRTRDPRLMSPLLCRLSYPATGRMHTPGLYAARAGCQRAPGRAPRARTAGAELPGRLGWSLQNAPHGQPAVRPALALVPVSGGPRARPPP